MAEQTTTSGSQNVQGPDDELSNFYPFSITVRKKNYKSAEHAYQALKARHHKNYDLEKNIEEAEDAFVAKRLSKQVVPDKRWMGQRAKLIQEIIEEKATQCAVFKDKLMESGTKELLHTVEDLYWGVGDDGRSGQNVFGKLLMALRKDIEEGKMQSKSQREQIRKEKESAWQRKSHRVPEKSSFGPRNNPDRFQISRQNNYKYGLRNSSEGTRGSFNSDAVKREDLFPQPSSHPLNVTKDDTEITPQDNTPQHKDITEGQSKSSECETVDKGKRHSPNHDKTSNAASETNPSLVDENDKGKRHSPNQGKTSVKFCKPSTSVTNPSLVDENNEGKRHSPNQGKTSVKFCKPSTTVYTTYPSLVDAKNDEGKRHSPNHGKTSVKFCKPSTSVTNPSLVDAKNDKGKRHSPNHGKTSNTFCKSASETNPSVVDEKYLHNKIEHNNEPLSASGNDSASVKEVKPKCNDSWEDYIAVQGAKDVLSNFSLYNMEMNGKVYRSAEHAYQSMKAEFHELPELSVKIMNAKTASAAKGIAKQIETSKEWEQKSADVMLDILVSKAAQCAVFRKWLKKSGDKELVHTVPNVYWGTGTRVQQGQNMFGVLLMKIREKLLKNEIETKMPPLYVPTPSISECESVSRQKMYVKMVIIADSMLSVRRLAERLEEILDIDAVAFIYPGLTMDALKEHVRELELSEEEDASVEFILVHAGHNNLKDRNEMEINESASNLCTEIYRVFNGKPVIFAVPPFISDNPDMNSKIEDLVDYLSHNFMGIPRGDLHVLDSRVEESVITSWFDPHSAYCEDRKVHKKMVCKLQIPGFAYKAKPSLPAPT